MRDFEYLLSIARGFAVPEEEARQAAADALAVRVPTVPQRDAATERVNSAPIVPPIPPWRAAS